MVRHLGVASFILSITCAIGFATDFYVAPNGTAGGTGTTANPWDLQTALNQPPSVQPGDTIWLLGGTYSGSHTSHLNGTASNPIVLRQFPGDKVTLDGGNSNGLAILTVDGSYAWFWGFEVMSSDPTRQSSQTGSWPTDIFRGDGVASGGDSSPGIKLINLTIHDTRQGISAFSTWSDTEVYGCLIYYNGWNGPDNGHGHGVYTQNHDGYKNYIDSVIFQQFAEGIQAYTETSYIDNISVEGTTFFNNGDLATSGPARNLLVGGQVVTHNPSVLNNFMYYPNNDQPASSFYLGYTTGCVNATVSNNYLANNTYLPNCDPASMTGNTFYGNTVGFTPSQYPNNTYLTSPSGTDVFIRPNTYEPGRANITIFNWGHADAVDVDLTGAAYPGTSFQILNVQDPFGAPVVSGTYGGGTVSVPMSGLTVAAPVGWPAPPPTGPEFNAFLLLSLPGPYDFFDVAPGNPFHDAITRVSSNGITAGCGGGNFCPNAAVRRDQMAVFLLKSEHGSAFAPPAATGTVFTDVPTSAFAADWIEQIASEGITSGCGSDQYCPRSPVTRAQMAVMLLRAELGATYMPPAATGTVFSDVPADAFAAAWIEDLANRGITAGCGSGRFCPDATVSRGQMAAFLVKTFALQ